MIQSRGRHDPYAALRIPAFRRYLSGFSIFVMGTQMLKVAIGWEIYERTGSAFDLGFVGLVQFLPLVVLVIPAGHVADSYNRKRVLLGSLALSTVAALGLAFNSARHGSIAVMYILLLLTGTAKAFQSPARAWIVPGVVPRDIFSIAASWNSSGFELASMAGPALGGLIIGFSRNPVTVYLLTAASTVIFMMAASTIPYRHHLAQRSPVTLRSLSGGIRFVWHQKEVMAAMTLDMFAVLLGGATTLMPVYAKDILGVGPRGLGWLMASPSVGAFAAAMIQAHRRPYERAGRALLPTVLGFGGATILFGLSRHFWFSLLMLFLIGVFDNVSVVIRNTLIQLMTPDDMRGRVTALNSLFIGTSNELGGFESGLVAGAFGPVVSVVTGGIGTLLVVLSVARLWPEIRRYGKLTG